MKVDIVKANETCKVFPRLDDEYGEYDGKPLFEADSVFECEEWCEDKQHKSRIRQMCSLIPAKFIHDVEAKADTCHRQMIESSRKIGWDFVTDVTYHASAAWKDEPTHYCYIGDSGATGHFTGYDEEQARSKYGKIAMSLHNRLCDYFEILWELGLTLTFDKEGKHTVYGNTPKWVTVDD